MLYRMKEVFVAHSFKSVKNPKSNRKFKRDKRDRRVDAIMPIEAPKGFWAANQNMLIMWFCALAIPAIGVAAGFYGYWLVVCVILWVVLPFYPIKLYRDHKALLALGADAEDELLAQEQFKLLEEERQ